MGGNGSDLSQLRELAQADLTRAKTDLERARAAYERAVERLQHIQALVELDGPPDADRRATPRSAGSGDSAATDAAAEILKQRAPLHYRELYSEVERLGVLIKGASPANTFLTRMLRDGRFRPTGQRGYYELAPEGHEHFRPAAHRKKGAA